MCVCIYVWVRVCVGACVCVGDGYRGVMVTVVGNGHSDMSSNPRQAVCITLSANTNWKAINPFTLSL